MLLILKDILVAVIYNVATLVCVIILFIFSLLNYGYCFILKKQKQKQKQKKKAWHLLLHVDALDIDAYPSTVKAKEYFSSSCS
jgi:hypothetical protein